MRLKCIRPEEGLTVGKMYQPTTDDAGSENVMVIDDSGEPYPHSAQSFSAGVVWKAFDRSVSRLERAVGRLDPGEDSQKQYVKARNEILGRVEMLLDLLEELQDGDEGSSELVDSMNLVERIRDKYDVVVSLLAKDVDHGL